MNKNNVIVDLERFSQGYSHLKTALEKYPDELVLFKPAPEKWCYHEIVVHLADADAVYYGRIHKCIAEPGSAVDVYDENLWARNIPYLSMNLNDSLELIRNIRLNVTALLRLIPEDKWDNTIVHPEVGIMTLGNILENVTEHVPLHLAQMERNYNDWQKRNR